MIGHLKFKLEAIILLFGRLPRQSKQSNSSTRILNDKQRKVKMARYWPSFFFVLTSRWVNKGFIIWLKDYTKEFRFCRNNAGNPERAR